MRAALLALLALGACEIHSPASSDRKAPPPAPPPTAGRVEFIKATADVEVADYVRAQVADLRTRGRKVLVYDGATWCEPCQQFHEAAAKGKLDAALPNLTFLEFDSDRDGERLAMAGYLSRLIPLFAAPGPDGRSSGRQIEGGIKGNGAVDEIVSRLRGLVDVP